MRDGENDEHDMGGGGKNDFESSLFGYFIYIQLTTKSFILSIKAYSVSLSSRRSNFLLRWDASQHAFLISTHAEMIDMTEFALPVVLGSESAAEKFGSKRIH